MGWLSDSIFCSCQERWMGLLMLFRDSWKNIFLSLKNFARKCFLLYLCIDERKVAAVALVINQIAF